MECTPKTPGILDDLLDQLDCLCEDDEDTSSSIGTGGTASGLVSGSVSADSELQVNDAEGRTCGGETETLVETEQCSAEANFDKADWTCTPVATPKK